MKKKFSLYPLKNCHFKKDKRHFYECYIFSTKEEMVEWNKKTGCESKNNYEAITRSNVIYNFKDGKKIKSKGIGAISFYIGRTGSGIVSHEMTHAALYWLFNEFGSPAKLKNSLVDECFAWVQGNLVRQFWSHFYRLEKLGWIKK